MSLQKRAPRGASSDCSHNRDRLHLLARLPRGARPHGRVLLFCRDCWRRFEACNVVRQSLGNKLL
ncbi:MAG: hypothetical protein ACRD68_13965 [Pyrinomonadaceae bacterium]